MILAAGAASRLRPLSDERPKALLPVRNVPLICRSLDLLVEASIDDVWVNVHHQAEAFEALELDVRISYEREQRLGTAGALRKLAPHLVEPFVVMNGDILCPLAVDKLIETHNRASAPATLAIVRHRTSDLWLDDERLGGWSNASGRLKPGWKWTGIAVFDPEVLAYIPKGVSGLYETVLTGLSRDARNVGIFRWEGYWNDIGTPSAYLKANLDGLEGADLVDDSAKVEGSDLRHCVIGKGVRIEAGSTLERCVVWDGVDVARGDYRDAVITSTLSGGFVPRSEDA